MKADHLVRSRALSAMEELFIGVLAGVASKAITLPISTVRVRQQLEETDGTDNNNRLSIIEILRSSHRESGLLGLFPALPLTIPLALLPSLTLYIHNILLRMLVPARIRSHPPGTVTFLLGAASNALATIPMYPLVLVKALSQSGTDKGKYKEGNGMIGSIGRIVNNAGIGGLYKGIEGQLAKGVVQQGVMMLVKQR